MGKNQPYSYVLAFGGKPAGDAGYNAILVITPLAKESLACLA